jgi:hypothetical protein
MKEGKKMEAWVTETLDWVEQSQAEREAETAAFNKRMEEIKIRHANQQMRLDVVKSKLDKLAGQVDNIKADLEAYLASRTA